MHGVLRQTSFRPYSPVMRVETTRTERSSRKMASQIRATQLAMAKHVLPLRAMTSGPARRTWASSSSWEASAGAREKPPTERRPREPHSRRPPITSVLANHDGIDRTGVDIEIFAENETQALRVDQRARANDPADRQPRLPLRKQGQDIHGIGGEQEDAVKMLRRQLARRRRRRCRCWRQAGPGASLEDSEA